MNFSDTVRLSWRQIMRSKQRSLLSVLAVAIGVTSVAVIASCGNFAAKEVSGQLRALGVDGMVVYRQKGREEGLPDSMAERLEALPDVDCAVPLNISVGSVFLRDTWENTAIVGTGERIADALHLELCHGRMPDASEIEHGSMVAAIDEAMALKYYRRTNVVGKTLRVKSGDTEAEYEICGVIKEKTLGLEAFLGQKLPYIVYIPHTTIQGGNGKTAQLAVRCGEDSSTETAVSSIINTVSDRDGNTDYAVENISAYIERAEAVAQILSVFAAGVGCIALLVAGVGVMNSMLASGELRRRETGIYLAIGAARRNILSEYLCESVMLTFAGGVCGTAAAVMILASLRFVGLRIGLSAGMLVISLAVTAASGLIFGLVPAIRASAMQPVDALRE